MIELSPVFGSAWKLSGELKMNIVQEKVDEEQEGRCMMRNEEGNCTMWNQQDEVSSCIFFNKINVIILQAK